MLLWHSIALSRGNTSSTNVSQQLHKQIRWPLFVRDTRARVFNTICFAGWLADELAVWLLVRWLAAAWMTVGWQAGYWRTGWLAVGWLASWLARRWLVGWLAGWLAAGTEQEPQYPPNMCAKSTPILWGSFLGTLLEHYGIFEQFEPETLRF